MKERKKAYYDVPEAWKPSANFANRPITDISDFLLMDETFMLSESSASSLSDAGDLPGSALESPTTPTAKVASASEERRPRGRSISNGVDLAEWPRLRNKSATAPPGGVSGPGYTPQTPRRAISARLGELGTIEERTPQQETYVMETRKLLQHKQTEQYRHQPKSLRIPPPRPPRPEDSVRTDSQVTIRAPRPGSFSQKARVKKTLEGKKMGWLNTRIVDFESRGLLSSPTSLLHTPRELYPIPEKRSAGHEHWRASGNDPSSPHCIDARRSIMSSLSTGSPQSHRVRRKESSKRCSQAKKPRMYVPGPIRIEGHHAQLRKGSVASLNPFDGGTMTRNKRYSDMIVLNSLTMYFAELSVVEDATEECLDRYWLETPPVQHHVASRTKPSISSIEGIPIPDIAEVPRRPS